jgi:hypothetical protein
MKQIVAIKVPRPNVNVGDPDPYPRWWVFDAFYGERVGWINNEPSGAFICFKNNGIRCGMEGSLEKALEQYA